MQRVQSDIIKHGGTPRIMNTAPAPGTKGFSYHASRVLRALKVATQLATLSDRKTSVYIAPDGGYGIIYNVLHAFALRLRHRGPIFFHHHNYSHINHPSAHMARMCRWLSDRLTHIFLETEMADAFERVYGPAYGRMIVRNIATCDVSPATAVGHGPVTISHLSNLMVEKGFETVMDVFQVLAERHPKLRFALAGAPVDARAKAILERGRKLLGDRLDYHGPLHGDAKNAFFHSTDIFLFPSVYRLEAQPYVIYEAMAGGAATVATNHACIPFMFGQAPHRLVSVDGDLVENCVAEIEDLLRNEADEATRAARHAQAVEAYSQMRLRAQNNYDDMITCVVAAPAMEYHA